MLKIAIWRVWSQIKAIICQNSPTIMWARVIIELDLILPFSEFWIDKEILACGLDREWDTKDRGPNIQHFLSKMFRWLSVEMSRSCLLTKPTSRERCALISPSSNIVRIGFNSRYCLARNEEASKSEHFALIARRFWFFYLSLQIIALIVCNILTVYITSMLY